MIYGEQYNHIGDTVFLPHGVILDVQLPLTFTASGLPPGLTIDRSSGAIRGVIASEAITDVAYTVTVDAKDSTQPRAWITRIEFDWWISVRVDDSLAQNTITGDPVYLRLPTPTGCGLTPPFQYFATGLPDGLTATSTGEITGTITAVPDTYTVHVEVIDSSAPPKVIRYDFAWVVSPRPTLDQWSFVGETVSFPVPNSGRTAPFWYIAASLPPGLMIDSSTGIISGTILPGAEAYSPYPVYLFIVEGDGMRSLAFQWFVTLRPTSTPSSGPGTAL